MTRLEPFSMSVENEEVLVTRHEETSSISSKQPKFSYTRDFLLSLSDLEACKKLPSGFDASILSEFDDVSHGIPDRQRSGGSLPLQGFRRNEYGSSPPARGDSGSNYSRGLNRWDSRSSGRSDTDSQSDKDSDSGRRYGNQYRRSWQNPEHDGLLGSGSFPRPPGYGGSTAPKFRPNENSQLNKSNEPYHPPRPYKAAPPFRRETDSLNDETFGSTDCTSEDRVEEEKKRRAEFEMMRKEQHKVLQEKLKLKQEKMEDPLSDIPERDTILNESDEPGMKLAPQNDTGKLPVSSQVPPSRPLVPPGFASTLLEKSSGSKSVAQPSPAEVGKSDRKDIHQDEAKLAEHICSSKKQSEIASLSTETVDLTSPLESSSQANVDSHPRKTSNISGVFNVLENSETVEEVAEHSIMGESGRSTSILEKLFGSALTVNDNATPRSSQDLDTRINEVWSPDTGSSKFTPWFQREEKKPREDASLGKSNDLLSLIVGGEKDGSTMSEMKLTQRDSDVALHMAPNSTATAIESSQQLYYDNKPEAVPAVLTCEDLEQSILSEVGANRSKSRLPAQGCNALSAEGDESKANIDNNASQHLLSLLQKGTDSKNISMLPIFDDGSPNKQAMFETGKIGESHINTNANTNASDPVKLSTSEKTLTLEALFGTAFMKELQSTNAPVSERKNSVDAFRIDGGAFPNSNDSFISPAANGMEFKGTNRDGSALHSVDKIEGHWLGLEASSNKVELLKRQSELEPIISGFDGPSDIRLPEEDSLISMGDPVGAQNAMFLHDLNVPNSEFLSSSSDGGVNIVDKLRAAVNNKRSVTGQEGLPSLRGPYDMVTPEGPCQNVHAQSSPPFHPPHVNHGRPIFHPLDSHPSQVDPQMKFMAPDGAIHHDTPMHHPFAGKTVHPLHRHPSSGLHEFDHPAHHPILQQMHIPNSLPPPHLLQGFPGGMPMPPPSNNPAGYLPEHNPIQGFPFGQPQPNLNGLGMPLPGPEHGGMNNPSDVFQRLMEMEMRSNPKQMQRLPPGNHGRPMHGPQLETGLWYR